MTKPANTPEAVPATDESADSASSSCAHCGGENPAVPAIVAKRTKARSLFWRGWTPSQIAEELDVAYTTVVSWRNRHKWEEAPAVQRAEEGTLERYLTLLAKDKKTSGDFKEIDLLGRQFEKLARVAKFIDGGTLEELAPQRAKGARAANKKKEKTKNLISHELAEKLREDLSSGLFGHQETWLSTTSLRTRMILKSRQIGATWYFARERLLEALETGKNQIFISASRAQAHIFRNYIVDWVRQVGGGLELKGDPLVIQRTGEDGEALEAVTLYFLGTNYRTAQGYSGDVIIDECFWIHGFEEIFKVASAIATHKQFTRTLFSTPSTLAHEAYAMWSGERINRRRAKADKLKIPIDHETLKGGALGEDGVWRHIVSIFDAIEGGFNLVDVEELQLEYSADEFDNLFRCIFLDDSQSMFPFQLMRRCMVDSWDLWRDFSPYALQPYAGEVWLGYDPNASESTTGDDAALVAVAAPTKPGGKFRVLEKKRLKGLDFAGQAAAVKEFHDKYNVTKIGIDVTGAGKAVHELVRRWFPAATAIKYSLESKTNLVLKAKNVISTGRLEFDAGWLDVMGAFMAIRPQITKGGGKVTYVAGRANGIGHADLAWSIMHALQFEPLDASEAGEGNSTMEIS